MPPPSATKAGPKKTTPTGTGIDFGPEETEEEEAGASPGSRGWFEQEFGQEQAAQSWQEMVYGRLPGDVASWANSIGEDPEFVVTWLMSQMPTLLFDVQNQAYRNVGPSAGLAAQQFYQTPEGLERIYNMALDWVRAKDSRFQGLSAGSGGRGRGGGRGGGGGGGPTADDIRKMFDIDQLTTMANDIWFNTVLDEAPNARQMAKAYVETVVKNPDQKLDYETFIRKQVEASERFKSIYKRKPDGMKAEEFIAPLYAMANSVVGQTDEAADLAVGAAKFGGDPNAFRQRLERTDSHRNSSTFIQGLEQTMGAVSSVLKG